MRRLIQSLLVVAAFEIFLVGVGSCSRSVNGDERPPGDGPGAESPGGASEASDPTDGDSSDGGASQEPPSWEEIERWIEEQKYAAARDGAAARLERLDPDRESAEWTRALVKTAQLELGLHGYETAVRRLRATEWPDDPTSSAVLQLIYAHTLRTYLSSYRWEIEQRERVVADDVVDLKQWTRSQLVAEIQRAFERVWDERARWGVEGLGEIDEYVQPSGYPESIRGTLRDAVTYLWVEALADSSLWSPAQSQLYRLSIDDLLQGNGSTLEGGHPLERLSAVLADLAAWHRDGERPEAALEARLELYRRLHAAMTDRGDRRAVRRALEAELDRFGREREWWAVGQVLLAELVRTEDDPESLVRARALALEAVAAHPRSLGGQRAAHVVASIEAPAYRLHSMQVDGPRRRSILVQHRNLERLWFRAYRLDLVGQVERATDYNLLPRRREIEQIVRRAPDLEWSIELPETIDWREHRTFVVPPIDAPALYLVVASAEPEFRFHEASRQSAVTLIVSDLVLLGRAERDRAEISIRNGANGQPAADVRVVRYRYDYRKGHRRIDHAETDEDGVARFELDDPARDFFFVAERDDHVGLLRMRDGVRAEPAAREQAVLYTDRSIYRPKQRILWKAVAYRAKPGEDDYRVLPERAFSVQLYDANGEQVAESSVTANEFGSASGEFSIPAGRVLGAWSLRTTIGGSSSIRVEEYKRPTFEVELDEPTETLRLNRPARLTGSASYLFGLPLAGGEVRWRVERAPVYASYRWGWSPPPVSGEIIAAGEAEVGSSGEFEIQFTPEADERAAEARISYRYVVHAEVTDEGGETRSAERAFRLGFVTVEARLTPSRVFYQSSDPIEIRVARTDLDGVHRPGAGRWELIRLRGEERAPLPADLPRIADPEEGAFHTPGDLESDRWTGLRAPTVELASWRESELVGTGTLEHPEGPDPAPSETADARLELGTLAPAAYRVRYTSEDPYGAAVEGTVDFVVLREGRRALPLALYAEPVATTVRVGDSARLAVFSGLPDAEILVEIFRSSRRIEAWTMRSREGVRLVEIPVTAKLRGGFSVRVSTLSDYQILRREHSFSVPWSDRELSLALTSFRDRVRPGDHETWRVRVLGADGDTPEAEAEVLAYMYDRSLDLFAPHAPPELAGLFPNRSGFGLLAVALGSQGELWASETGFASLPGYPSLQPARIRFYPAYGIGGVGARRRRPTSLTVGAQVADERAEMAPMLERVEERALAAKAMPASSPPVVAAPAPQIRENFAETAFWEPHLVTDADGGVAIEFIVPDSLTEWRVWLSALTRDLSSGTSHYEIVSAKELMVRPYLPRFVREGDAWVARVLVRNAGEVDLTGAFDFDLVDPETEASVAGEFGLTASERTALPIELAAGEEIELQFNLETPARLGAVAVRAVATTENVSDGELRLLPILPGRVHLAQSRFVTLRDEDRRELHFADLAADDDPTRIDDRMIVTLDGQLFYSVLHALPYLVHYPYECTEQTLNRFLSTGIVSGLYGEYPEIRQMAERFSARETRLEAWEADDPNRAMALEETPWLVTAHGGEGPSGEEGGDDLINVLDPKRATAEERRGLARLEELQTASGGFPWMPGGPPSPYMTLYLLTGFSRAIEFGIEVPRPMVERAWAYMHRHYIDELVERSLAADCCWERVTFLNFVLSSYDESWAGGVFTDEERTRMLDFSFRHWKAHSPRLKLYLALTLAREGRSKDAELVWASVVDSAITTPDEGTYWAPEDRAWLWYNDTIETHALALRAMMELDAADERRHGLVQWLLLNKKLGQWKSTRATAEVIYSLVHYLKAEGQLAVREQVDVAWGPRSERFVFEPDEYTGARQRIEVEGEQIDPATDATIVVEKETPGFLFASATWHFSTEELPDESRGDLLAVTRRYYRRVQKGTEWTLEPLDESAIGVGDQLEVHLSIRAKHAAEYVHLRDPRPAGFEPEIQVSRYRWDLGIGRYEEVRDSGTNFFFDRLPAGEYTLKYRLRANVEGTYKAGPAIMQSMYAPEFVAYSAGRELAVE